MGEGDTGAAAPRVGDLPTIGARPSVLSPAMAAGHAGGLMATRSGSAAGVRSSREFLQRDRAERAKTFSLAMLAAVVLGGIFVVVLPADPVARAGAAAAMVVIGVAFLALFVHTAKTERFKPRYVGITAHLIALGSVPIAYYCGVFSPFPGVVALALLIYALDSQPWWALSVTLVAAGGQLGLAVLVMGGEIEDRGIFAVDAPRSVQVAGQAAVMFFYAIAFIVGRASNRRTAAHARELEAAVGQIAAREALLREARQELEQAAGIGDPGRFSEQVLGPWRLGLLLGRGGMGEIYEAHHTETGEPAAIKLLLRGAYAGTDPIRRFAREAAIAASLDCEEVVSVLDIGGPEAPLPYIAMERLEGQDLSAMLRERRRLTPDEVARLADAVATALDEAAKSKIVHRDLKPSNVFLTTDARWKVLDFGVSKLMGESGTLTGANVVGTPGYMAPEQARGEAVDHRSDLYSLAVIVYRALTGQPAFSGKDFGQMLILLEETLPARPSALADVPEGVDDVLRVAMAKAPSARFESGAAFADAFKSALANQPNPSVGERATTLCAHIDWAPR